MLKNTINSYGSISKFFHWFITIAIIALIIVGYNLESLKIPILYKIHGAIGFMVLLLVIARLLWRFGNVTPTYDRSMPKWMVLSAHMMHYGLYALMIVIPIAGFIHANAEQHPVSFMFLFDMPLLFASENEEVAKLALFVHQQIALILIIAISAHALVALYHHYIKKDNILKRMLPFNQD